MVRVLRLLLLVRGGHTVDDVDAAARCIGVWDPSRYGRFSTISTGVWILNHWQYGCSDTPVCLIGVSLAFIACVSCVGSEWIARNGFFCPTHWPFKCVLVMVYQNLWFYLCACYCHFLLTDQCKNVYIFLTFILNLLAFLREKPKT